MPDIPAPADVAAIPDDATKTDSGLAYRILEASDGSESPRRAGTKSPCTHGVDHRRKDVRQQQEAWPPCHLCAQPGRRRMDRGRPAHEDWTERTLRIPEEPAYKGNPVVPPECSSSTSSWRRSKSYPPPDPPADLKAPPADAQKTASGLAYKIIEPGKSERGEPWDAVKINYTGWTSEGKMFDSTIPKARPTVASLDRAIKGWIGSPAHRSRRENPPVGPRGAELQGRPRSVFEMELIEIVDRPKPPPAPEDVAAPEGQRPRAESSPGREIRQGRRRKTHQGGPRLRELQRLDDRWENVRYSTKRGKPATFGVGQVIAGWTDALQQMRSAIVWVV